MMYAMLDVRGIDLFKVKVNTLFPIDTLGMGSDRPCAMQSTLYCTNKDIRTPPPNMLIAKAVS